MTFCFWKPLNQSLKSKKSSRDTLLSPAFPLKCHVLFECPLTTQQSDWWTHDENGTLEVNLRQKFEKSLFENVTLYILWYGIAEINL